MVMHFGTKATPINTTDSNGRNLGLKSSKILWAVIQGKITPLVMYGFSGGCTDTQKYVTYVCILITASQYASCLLTIFITRDQSIMLFSNSF